MPRSDPIQGITTPLGSEAMDGAANLASLTDQIVPKLSMRFASTAARDSAISSGNRKAGMRAWIDAVGYWTAVYADAGSWVREGIRDVFLGTEGVCVGSSPPAGTLKIRQEFTGVSTTNGVALVGFAYPTAFPNGIVNITAVPGDNASSLGQVVTIIGNQTLASWYGQCFTVAGATILNSAVRVNITAVGW